MEPELNPLDNSSTEQINYPWLVFRLGKSYYAINSRLISGIMQPTSEIAPVPNAPDYVRGIFILRGNVVQMVDLRGLLGLETLEQAHANFCNMLDMRKQDHLNWVRELERCVEEGDTFKLATDPHKCAFGKWYDHFSSDTSSVNFHMKKIDEPHRKLHECATRISDCHTSCDLDSTEDCMHRVFDDLNATLVPQIVSLIDETKTVFKGDMREMLITVEQGDLHIGLLVDEVIAVEHLSMSYDNQNIEGFEKSPFVSGVCKSETISSTLLMLDCETLLSSLGKIGVEE